MENKPTCACRNVGKYVSSRHRQRDKSVDRATTLPSDHYRRLPCQNSSAPSGGSQNYSTIFLNHANKLHCSLTGSPPSRLELFVSLTIALEEQYLMGPPIPTDPLNTMRGRDDIAQVDSAVTTNGAPSPVGRADSSNN